jgi:hypothetical protein
MSTTNIQNYLSNVFRPAYTYNTTTSQFQASLNMSNINDLTVNSLAASQFNIGDINGNVYVGSNAGNTSDTLRDAFRNVALGATAGFSISNVQDSIFIGYASGLNTVDASSIIAIGKGTITGGSETIYIGTETGNILGSNNIFIGHGISPSAGLSDRIFIGVNSSGQTVFNADLSQNRVGILTSNPRYDIELGAYTYVQDGLGINADPREHTLNVNGDMFVEDGYGFMTFDHDEVTSNSVFNLGSYTPGKKMIVSISGDLLISGFLNISAGTSQTEVTGQTVTALNFLNAPEALTTLGTTNISGILTTTSGAVFHELNVSGLTVRGPSMDASQTSATFSNIGARANLNVSGTSFFGGNALFTSSTIDASSSTLRINALNGFGSLNVSGNSFFGSNLNVGNTTNLVTLNVSSNFTQYGIMNVSGQSFFSSPVTMNTSLSVSNKSFFYNDLEVSGNLIIRGNTVTNTDATYRNIVANGTLNVSDSTFLRGGLFVRGALNMSGGGAINASSSSMNINSLLVRNGLSASGSITLNTLTVSGPAVFSNAGTFATLESLGVFTVGGVSTLSNTGVRGTLNVSGASQFASLLTASGVLVSSNLGVRGGVNVSGASLFTSLLTASGILVNNNLGVQGGINVSGASLFTSNLGVFGTFNASGSSVFTSNVAVSGGFNVLGSSIFSSNLGVSGAINVSGNILSASGIGVGTTPATSVHIVKPLTINPQLTPPGASTNLGQLFVGVPTNSKRLAIGFTDALGGAFDGGFVQAYDPTANTVKAMGLNPNGGGIGINLWSPLAPLDISGNIIVRRSTGTNGYSGKFSLVDPSLNSPLNTWGIGTYNVPSSTTAGADFTLARLNTGGAVQGFPFYIRRDNGHVGINNITPSVHLDVSGDTGVSGTLNVSGSLFALGPLRGPKNYKRYQFFNPQQDVTTSTAFYPNFASNVRISSNASPSTIVNLTFTLSPAVGEQDIRTFDTLALYVYGIYIDGLSVVIGPRADNIASLTKRSNLIDLGNPSASTYGGYTATRAWSTLTGSPPSDYLVVGHNENNYYSTNSLMFVLQSNFDYNSATASITFPIADGRNGTGGTVFTYLGTPVIFQAVPLYC